MLLRRLGNKSKIASRIYDHFPSHKIYIEAFFGAGGMFFNKPKAKYNILNDLDSDVYNLFNVVSTRMDELEAAFLQMPMHQDLWDYWRKNTETDPIRKAVRFLFLSNYGFMGKANTLRYLTKNTSKILYDNIRTTNEYIFGCEFSNFDFRELFRRIPLNENIDDTFIYCDPPYLFTADNYSNSFTVQDAVDLFDVLVGTKCRFAYSEFDNPIILEQAEKRGLNIVVIGERRNLGNRRTEILITNYKKKMSLFD